MYHAVTLGTRTAVALLLVPTLAAQVTQLVDVSSVGSQANTWSRSFVISSDGRFVTFRSTANNLVSADSNGLPDVFVRDRIAGLTERISIPASGGDGNGESIDGWITPNGRYVAFTSYASNLVQGDTNGSSDAFVRDRLLNTTEAVSLNSAGVIGDAPSGVGSITPDGRFVCFASRASNIAPGAPSGYGQVYVRDRLVGTTDIVSVSTGGIIGNNDSSVCRISDDGQLVAFLSASSNLVTGDTNNRLDVFLHDRQSGLTERVSLTSTGSQADGSSWNLAMSGDGRYITFVCGGSNLVTGAPPFRLNLYLRDRQQDATELVSVDSNGTPGNGDCFFFHISGNGRFVVFESDSSNLVLGDTNQKWDVFVRDRHAGITSRESLNSMQVEGDQGSFEPAISADGRFVAFSSIASNFVPGGDNNVDLDVFVRDRADGTRFRSFCSPGTGIVGACPCMNPPIGPDRGCNNSSGTGGASLDAVGGTFLSSDSLQLTTTGEVSTALSIVSQWSGMNGAGVIFGMGVRCTSGGIKRLYSKHAVGGSIVVPDFGAGDSTVSARSAAEGDTIQAGQSRWYVVFYRDQGILGGCPPTSNFNCTQTGQVTWSP